ncbi:3-hydroxybutyryl-CoA dehydrogenase [Rubrobacter xylanophilus DSM 9941]|uniref:3-hydroxyacyl-CoA dehydrogenase family protein n=1 Tax=Rubrobacter xylanophilus TaxID=49319 RepID=UPI001C63E756|nr:3-hydroxyacyl-CoA dehydrogenase family protein [Rubrobacter xylanophilus]QYJ17276.1 3-hydroxybutyryl-CoA dehydrogenase [Rubrobacter xylanophilus DSM 9941]
MPGTVGVLGTGTMGAGITQVAAQAGYRVLACDVSEEALKRARRYVQKGLESFARKGVIPEEDAEAALGRIRWTTAMEELAESGAVIEAIVERVGPKKEAFAALDGLLPPEALLLTNTSSISITELASATKRPERVCGTHFFTPPPLREAVEVVRGEETSDETVERVRRLLSSFGKLPVMVRKDVPGFVANRLLMPVLLEAARLLEEGVAGKEEIDQLATRGLGFPVGPFQLADLIGLDVALDVISYVHAELGEPYYAPPRLLKNMVRSGRLGRKSGEGFYRYGGERWGA